MIHYLKTMSPIKVIPLLMLLALISLSSYSQETEGSFLLRDGKAKLSTFYVELSPGTSFSALNKQLASTGELNAGLILNNRFTVSFFMTGSPKINTVAIPDPFSEEWFEWINAGVELEKVSADAEFLYVKFKHSGLRFGYMHNTQNTIFWRGGLAFGFMGGLSMTESQTFMGMFDNLVWESSILTLTPDVGVGINLLPWWRVHFDIGYRLMKVDENILKSTDTDSFTMKLGFSFGNFRYK